MKKLNIISKEVSPYTLEYFKKIDLSTLGYEELLDIAKSYAGLGNKYYSSPEYKEIYPYIDKVYKLMKSKVKESGEKVMKEMGVWYGDKVYYDYVSPFMGVEKYSGIIQKGRTGKPMVKLESGRTMNGSKSVYWHKGWKKIS